MLNEALVITNLLAICSIAVFRQWGILIAVFMLLIFLSLGISTLNDYEFYKYSFENLGPKEVFPYFYSPRLTAEPGYVLMMAAGRAIGLVDFSQFLLLHAVIFFGLSYWALVRLGFDKTRMYEVLILSLPSILPVILYWSPRSAFPIPLILLAYTFYQSRSRKLGVLVALTACIIHSQYIPFVFFMFLIVPLFRSGVVRLKTNVKVLVIGILMFLTFIKVVVPIATIVNPIPILVVPLYKLHYITEPYGGIRISGLVSIVVSSLVLFSLSGKSGRTETLLAICSIFSIMVAIIFLQNGHVAGRVARFTDYVVFTIGVSQLTRSISGIHRGTVLGFIAFLEMLLFNAVYKIG